LLQFRTATMKLRCTATHVLLAIIAVLLASLVAVEAFRVVQTRRYHMALRLPETGPADAALPYAPANRLDSIWASADPIRQMQQEINSLFQHAFGSLDTLSWPSDQATPRLRDDPAQEGQLLDQVRRMQGEIDRLFQRAFDDFQHFGGGAAFDEGWDRLLATPGLDIRDDGSNHVVTVNLPGVRKSDIRVTLDGSLLTISVPQSPALASPASEGRLPPVTTLPMRIERRIRLPGAIARAADVQAAFSEGVLRIVIPRAAQTNALEKGVPIR
jgi:HSP20 family protein